MSRGPFAIAKVRGALYTRIQSFRYLIGSSLPKSLLCFAFGNDGLAETADNVAKEVGVTRKNRTYSPWRRRPNMPEPKQPAISRMKSCRFQCPLERDHRSWWRKMSIRVLRPLRGPWQTCVRLFPGGVTTAGNASGINDGAGALIVGSAEIGEKYGVKPLVRIVAGAAAGVRPARDGSRSGAINKEVPGAGWTIAEGH